MKRMGVNKLSDGTIRFDPSGSFYIWVQDKDFHRLEVLNKLQDLNSQLLRQIKEIIK